MCVSKEGGKFRLGHYGENLGQPFLRVISDPSRTDCFFKLIANESTNYLSILSDEEFYVYYLRLRQNSKYLGDFDRFKLELANPKLGSIYIPYIIRSQESYEEELILTMEKIAVSSILLLPISKV